MHHVEQGRNFLNLVNDDSFRFLGERRELFQQRAWPQAVSLIQIRIEQIYVKRSRLFESLFQQQRFSRPARVEKEEAVFFRKPDNPIKHTL
jgi:hypothetical protein